MTKSSRSRGDRKAAKPRKEGFPLFRHAIVPAPRTDAKKESTRPASGPVCLGAVPNAGVPKSVLL
jgi:hypothetical protein